MTDNHTELCERLRTISSCPGWDEAREAAAVIESQAARIQQQASRIAELEQKHKEAWDDCGELNTANHELLAACGEKDRRIAELEKERDALREDARQFYNLTQGDATVIIRAPSAEKRDAIVTAANRLRAALQAEKESR